MQLYKLGQSESAVQQKVVLPLPPASPPQQQQPNQNQTPQVNSQATQADAQIIQFINQNKNSLPTIVKNALANPTQRAVVVALVESLADPANHDFIMRFINFTKSVAAQKQFQNSPS